MLPHNFFFQFSSKWSRWLTFSSNFLGNQTGQKRKKDTEKGVGTRQTPPKLLGQPKIDRHALNQLWLVWASKTFISNFSVFSCFNKYSGSLGHMHHMWRGHFGHYNHWNWESTGDWSWDHHILKHQKVAVLIKIVVKCLKIESPRVSLTCS